MIAVIYFGLVAYKAYLFKKYEYSRLFFSKGAKISMKSQAIFKLSALEEDILTVLANQSLYGLQIRQALEKANEGKRNIGEGSLYPTLHRMEKKGYVESQWGEDRPEERCGARRKYYNITGLGKQVLQERQQVRDNLFSVLQPSLA